MGASSCTVLPTVGRPVFNQSACSMQCEQTCVCIDNMTVCPDEDSEPLQKKLRLSTEEQDDSETPQFSVVTIPSETHSVLVHLYVLLLWYSTLPPRHRV